MAAHTCNRSIRRRRQATQCKRQAARPVKDLVSRQWKREIQEESQNPALASVCMLMHLHKHRYATHAYVCMHTSTHTGTLTRTGPHRQLHVCAHMHTTNTTFLHTNTHTRPLVYFNFLSNIYLLWLWVSFLFGSHIIYFYFCNYKQNHRWLWKNLLSESHAWGRSLLPAPPT